LIDLGADVNYRRSERYITALHHAARSTSAEAANLMKFLLLSGADPDIQGLRSNLRVEDEKGAKGISKWLGVSWKELVEQTKKAREKGESEANVIST
jgi:ankyrin repeat protein